MRAAALASTMDRRGGRRRRLVAAAASLTVLLLAALAAGSRAQPAASGWAERLEALRPEAPLEYFELAEEIADVAEAEGDRELARRLFALAGLLDADRLGRSACLALADLEETEQARARLLALAGLLGDQEIAPVSSLDTGAGLGRDLPRDAVLGVTEAFSHYRRGNGAQVSRVLKYPGAMDLLFECDAFLPGGANGFLEDSRVYRRDLRPSLSPDDLTLMLRLEVALLSGPDRPWSTELLFGGGHPLIEVDPGSLADAFEVDAARPFYRNGRWVREGG